MKIILIGYGELASSLLLGILESKHEIVGVLSWKNMHTNPILNFFNNYFYPDKFQSLIKAEKLHEIKAKKANSEKFIKEALKLEPDLILVGSWGEILKKRTIILPKIACVNCHPSLLPKHRGSNPYASTIMQNETKSGISFHLVDEKIDSGAILLQKEVNISYEDTGGTLRDKCSYLAKENVIELLDKLEIGMFLPEKQNEAESSYFQRLNDNDAKIRWNRPALDIYNKIRGMQPWMECYTQYKNDFILVTKAKIVKLNSPSSQAGEIIAKNNKKITVSTLDPYEAIELEKVKVYGFASFLWSDYFISKIKIGDFLK